MRSHDEGMGPMVQSSEYSDRPEIRSSSRHNISESFKEIRTVEPFRTEGKICVLSPSMIACLCDSAVKLVKLNRTVKQEPSNAQEVIHGIGGDSDEQTSSYSVIGHYTIEMDEICTFDVCPTSYIMMTSHKSGTLRKWDLRTGTATVLAKVPYRRPVDLLEIYKVLKTGLKDDLQSNGNGDFKTDQRVQEKSDLTFIAVAGNQLSVYRDSGRSNSQVLSIPPDNTLLTQAKWDSSGPAHHTQLVVAHIEIYVLVHEGGRLKISQVLKGHDSTVVGLEWYTNLCMISASSDRTFVMWNRTKMGSEYTKHRVLITKEPSVTTCMLNSDYLFLMSATNISFMNLKSGKMTERVGWWRKDEVITGAYKSIPVDGCCTEEVFITSNLGYIHCGQLTTICKPSSNEEFLRVDEYQGCANEIIAVKVWEQSTGTKIVVANITPIISVYNDAGEYISLIGHNSAVLSLATKGDYLISGSKDKFIIVWQAGSNVPLHTLKGHNGPVSSVSIGDGGGVGNHLNIYSVSEDLDLIKWKDNHPLTRTSAHQKEIHSVDCSPNEQLLVTASRDRTAKIWDASTLQLVGTLTGHKKTICDARFSKWDKRIVTSSRDTTLKIWNIETLTCEMTLQGHEGAVLQGFFVNNGLQVLSISVDGHWCAWELVTGTCVSSLESSPEVGPVALDSTSTASMVVSGSELGIMKIWADDTINVREEKLKAQKKKIQDVQHLNNLMAQSEWKAALGEAVNLDRPAAVLQAIRGFGRHKNLELPEVQKELNEIIWKLSNESKLRIQKYTKMWVTNKKTMAEGYIVSKALLMDQLDTRIPLAETSGYDERNLNRLQKREEHLSVLEHMANQISSIS